MQFWLYVHYLCINATDPAAGGSDDFAYDTGIKLSYTVELRDTGAYGFTLPESQVSRFYAFRDADRKIIFFRVPDSSRVRRNRRVHESNARGSRKPQLCVTVRMRHLLDDWAHRMLILSNKHAIDNANFTRWNRGRREIAGREDIDTRQISIEDIVSIDVHVDRFVTLQGICTCRVRWTTNRRTGRPQVQISMLLRIGDKVVQDTSIHLDLWSVLNLF